MADCYIIQNCHVKGIPIVSWQNGSGDDIAAMIAANDDGLIDLNNYWSVGDERPTHLSAMTAGDAFTTAMAAQDVVLVLMDTGSNSGYKDENDNTVNFVVGQKDCLSEYGRMNTTATNSGSWYRCAMCTDLNNKYYNAFSVTFKGCLKRFKTRTASEYNGSTITTYKNYVAIFGEKEVLGNIFLSNEVESAYLKQIKYYETAANRIKKYNTSADKWLLRSPYGYNANSFCAIGSDGAKTVTYGNSLSGIAPFMCI